jgi:hypothetical protein
MEEQTQQQTKTTTKTQTKATSASAGPAVGEGTSSERIVIVDLGKRQSGKRLRQLRRGRGPLVDSVREIVEDVRTSLSDPNDNPAIVIVVEKERKRTLFW